MARVRVNRRTCVRVTSAGRATRVTSTAAATITARAVVASDFVTSASTGRRASTVNSVRQEATETLRHYKVRHSTQPSPAIRGFERALSFNLDLNVLCDNLVTSGLSYLFICG